MPGKLRLQKIWTQWTLNMTDSWIGMASPSRLGVEGTEAVLQQLPGNQAVHTLRDQVPGGSALLALVFQVGKGWLVHTTSFPVSIRLFSLTMPHRRELVQSIPTVSSTAPLLRAATTDFSALPICVPILRLSIVPSVIIVPRLKVPDSRSPTQAIRRFPARGPS